MTSTYRVEFSVYGSRSGWRSAIVSAVTVTADSAEGARAAASAEVPSLTADPAAVRSITRVA